ncbi:MAG: hypothetical protein ACR5KV_07855 [Wolbachia sp.]
MNTCDCLSDFFYDHFDHHPQIDTNLEVSKHYSPIQKKSSISSNWSKWHREGNNDWQINHFNLMKLNFDVKNNAIEAAIAAHAAGLAARTAQLAATQ